MLQKLLHTSRPTDNRKREVEKAVQSRKKKNAFFTFSSGIVN